MGCLLGLLNWPITVVGGGELIQHQLTFQQEAGYTLETLLH